MKIVRARVEDAALVYRIMQAAFAEYLGLLDPPSSSHDETVQSVEQAIRESGALLAWQDNTPVASARYEVRPDCLYVGRVSVLPEHRRKGIAAALMLEMEQIARELSLPAVHVGVREALPSNLRLYERLGFEIVSIEQHPRGPDRTIRMTKWLDQIPPQASEAETE